MVKYMLSLKNTYFVFSSCNGMLHLAELSMVLVSQAASCCLLLYMDGNSKSS